MKEERKERHSGEIGDICLVRTWKNIKLRLIYSPML